MRSCRRWDLQTEVINKFMNKDDVIRHLTRQVLDKKQAKMSVDRVFEIIKHGLKRDGKVVISNFGSFHLKVARPVTRRNPKTGAKVQVPAKEKIRFKPSANILKGKKERV